MPLELVHPELFELYRPLLASVSLAVGSIGVLLLALGGRRAYWRELSLSLGFWNWAVLSRWGLQLRPGAARALAERRPMSYPFQIVDVFAQERYCGNQLAIFSAAERIPEELMQKLARETNFAETTFAYTEPVAPDTYRVRIFTPHEELPFAGHPTLGTAWALRDGRARVTLRLGVGDIPVTFDDVSELAWMRQKPPQYGEFADPDQAAALLGLSRGDLDPNFAPQVVSTGLAFLLIPLRGLAEVKRAAIDRRVERELLPKLGARFTFLFSRETYAPENQVNARMFAETTGVPEDPATGSANGCLAAYMVQHRYLGLEHVEARVEQGYEINRPSLLHLRADPDQINVGGKVIPTARGEFLA